MSERLGDNPEADPTELDRRLAAADAEVIAAIQAGFDVDAGLQDVYRRAAEQQAADPTGTTEESR